MTFVAPRKAIGISYLPVILPIIRGSIAYDCHSVDKICDAALILRLSVDTIAEVFHVKAIAQVDDHTSWSKLQCQLEL